MVITRSTGSYYGNVAFTACSGATVVYSIVANILFRLFGGRVKEVPMVQTPGRIAIVTGSNTGIGFESARSLVERGYEVILACRSRDKALKAVERIEQECTESSGKAVFLHPLDLSSFESVTTFSQVILEKYDSIHLLINNAGINTSGLSEHGLDLCFQANFLGHFLLTSLLLDKLVKTKGARIVNLSSVMHHFSAPSVSDRHDEAYWEAVSKWEPQDSPYAASKLAMIHFSSELQKRYNIRSLAVNPGAVFSDIWRGFPKWILPIFQTIYLHNRHGCATSVAAATLDDLDKSVLYLQPYWQPSSVGVPFPVMEMLGPFVGYRPTTPRFTKDYEAASNALWTVSEKLTGAKFPIPKS